MKLPAMVSQRWRFVVSNGHEVYLLGLYEAIFNDIASSYPSDRRGLSRDLLRLSSNVRSRGLHHLMVDLPDYGKHFDRCLANGLLVPSRLPTFGIRSGSTPIPSFLKGMMSRVFHVSGLLRADPDILSIRYIRQVLYLAKKYSLESSSERKFNVLRTFFEIEAALPDSPQEWGGSGASGPDRCDVKTRYRNPGLQASLPGLQSLEAESAAADLEWMGLSQDSFDLIAAVIGRFDPTKWRARHGPGAVSDLPRGRSKYDFPNWPDKLESVFPMADFGFANFGCWADYLSQSDGGGRFERSEPPSKLVFVPKTLKTPRLIAKEPTSHQWCQQLVRSFIDERVSSTVLSSFIHFRDQSYNQRAALTGSKDGKLATLDLSEASDRISCALVSCAFRNNRSFLNALIATRTRWCVNTIDYRLPRFHKLKKFASMGSACTFPVQSLIFLGLALTAVCYVRRLPVNFETLKRLDGVVLVFGDDLVVPTDCLGVLRAILERVGLKVNTAKTFGTGKFRESCGVDAFDGVDVTPTYALKQPVKARPESVISSVESGNNLLRAGYLRANDYIKSTVSRVYSRIPRIATGSGCFGFEVLGPAMNPGLRTRICADTHVLKTLCLQPQGREFKKQNRGDDALLQYFSEDPSPLTKWSNGYQTRRPKANLRLRWVTL